MSMRLEGTGTGTGGAGMGRGGDGLIDPELFVCRGWDLDPGLVGQAAVALAEIGAGVARGTADVHRCWQAMPGCYQAPEQERVYALMDPAAEAGRTIGDHLAKAARSLQVYESELGWFKHVLLEFEGRAAAFREQALQGYEVRRRVRERETNVTGGTTKPAEYRTELVPWYDYPPARAENERLLREYAEILVKIQTVAVSCAAELDQLGAMQCLDPSRSAVIDADTIMQTPQLRPWGAADRTPADRSCIGQFGNALGDNLYSVAYS